MPSRTDNFQKFVKQKKGSAIKEEIKQQKRKEKKEKAAAIEAHFERKRAEKQQRLGIQPDVTTSKTGRPNKYPKKDEKGPEGKEAITSPGKFKQENKSAPQNKGAKSPSDKRVAKFEKPLPNANSTYKKPPKDSNITEKSEPTFERQTTDQEKPVQKAPATFKQKAARLEKPVQEGKAPVKKTFDNSEHQSKVSKSNSSPTKNEKTSTGKTAKTPPVKSGSTQGSFERGVKSEQMPLNKYVAHGGLCSRRDAAIWVKEGKVTVNGELATDPGMKVSPDDIIKVGNKKVIPSKNFVYILLNKPKDYITTSDDPQGRKTVLDLVRTASTERVYPVGRLDRNTSGVLLLTNDGDLAQKLSHPKHEVKKVYEVRLDRALTKNDMDKIASGITLEDGFVAPDVIAYADAKDKSIIGVEIHSGRNRIVRRIFEHMKYDVKGLDRVMFAGLTKKDVQRGNWRLLKDKEIRLLKFMNQSLVKVND